MPASRRHLRTIPVLASALVLAACGSDDDTTSSRAGAPSTSTAAAPTTSTATDTPTTPRGRLQAMAAALGDVKSMHVEGTATDEDGPATLTGDVANDGTAQFDLKSGGGDVSFRVLGEKTYLRADETFWKSSADKGDDPAVAKQLADRWVVLPTTVSGFGEELEDLLPKTLAMCATVNVGTLRDGGTATVGGQRTTVVVDRGDTPGSTPGRLYVAADGPPLPLRLVQTGKTRAGGKRVAACDSDDDTTMRSDVRFSRFGEPLRLVAPKGAIEIPTPGSEGQATS